MTTGSSLTPIVKSSILGIIPFDWQVKKVGSLCTSIVPGRDKPKVFDGDIPWITTPDIIGRKITTSRMELFVSRQELRNCRGKTIPANSVVMSCVGEFGLVAIPEREVVINQQLHAFIPNDNLDSTFLSYALIKQKKWMLNLATTTAVPYLNKDGCESIPIPLPPLPEQHRIVAVLETWDAAIEKLKKKIELKKNIKKGLMQQLLTGKVRLPGFSGKWDRKILGDVCKIKMGQSPSSEFYTEDSSYPVLIQGNADLKKGYIVPRVYTKQITKECHIGDIIMTVRAPVGDLAISNYKACLGRGVCAIQATNYIYYLLCFIRDTNKWQKHSHGSTIDSINSIEIFNFKIKIPKVDEQEAISLRLQTMDKELEILEKRLNIYSFQKSFLLNHLVTGKIRTPENLSFVSSEISLNPNSHSAQPEEIQC